MDSEHCYKIEYMRNIKYIVPIENSYQEEYNQIWCHAGEQWPTDMGYMDWPQVAIILDKINRVYESRHLNEMSMDVDEIGEEKRPNFLTKLKF